MQQCRNNRGIHASAQSQQHLVCTDSLANLLNFHINEAVHRPIILRLADLKNKIFQYLVSILGMTYLRMELQRINILLYIASSRKCTGITVRILHKAISQCIHLITMTHPNNLLFRQSFENRRIRLNRNLCSSIFLCFTSLHTSAIHKMCHLHTITDTKNRNTGFKNCRIAFKRFLIIYTVWSTRENDSPDILQCQNFFQCHRVRVQFRINTKLTNTTCYQLVILTSEVKYDNFISHECILLIKKPIP